jgi:sulfoxide reductase heme-binding subunit YedZ
VHRPGLLQILVHAGAWIPLLVLLFDLWSGSLSINPYQAAERRTGNIALILLIASLACTPLYTLTRAGALAGLSRPLGLYAYMYAAIHLLIFVGLDYGFQLSLLWQDINEKRFIFAGLAAFLVLSALAITSFRWWMARLGKSWKRLHRLVYVANLLVVLHFAWAVKGDFFRLQGDVVRPLLALAVITLLLVMRIPMVRKRLSGRLRFPTTIQKQRGRQEV